MLHELLQIPEIAALEQRRNLIRIPGEQDVPITPRIRKLIDSQPFRRLAGVSQLGLVSLVYPGARHSRFEHALGAYRNALLFVRRLAETPEFQERVTTEDVKVLLVAALLHDLGHWPYCHPMEDMQLDGIPAHEALATKRIAESEIESVLRDDFGLASDSIERLLVGPPRTEGERACHSILSGPVDIDKMDYLYRDSLHCGVPYGMHFDRQRLVGSLCLHPDSLKLAITRKGITAAELMVFARYVMFREVYWHHAVRSATAMLQRLVARLHATCDLTDWFELGDAAFESKLVSAARPGEARQLAEGLFGAQRFLFKRIAEYSVLDEPEVFRTLSGYDYNDLQAVSRRLAVALSELAGQTVGPDDVLVDAPPPNLEIQFRIPVRFGSPGGDDVVAYRWLGDVSPVVQTLADRQFDNFVKCIRIFVHPRLADWARHDRRLRGAIRECLVG